MSAAAGGELTIAVTGIVSVVAVVVQYCSICSSKSLHRSSIEVAVAFLQKCIFPSTDKLYIHKNGTCSMIVRAAATKVCIVVEVIVLEVVAAAAVVVQVILVSSFSFIYFILLYFFLCISLL